MKQFTGIFPEPQTDLKNFRLDRLNQPQYRHMWFLLFWPVYGLRYLLLENRVPAGGYHLIHCPLDDLIPFQEGFLIFYALWYGAIIGMHVYTLIFDVAAFRKYTGFLILSMSISTAVFLLYPSCQTLRPQVFPRDNCLTRLVGILYRIDTSTNVFPSEHAIGAIGVFCASLHTKGLRSPGKTAIIGLFTVLISLSTVFLKQHSVLDVAAALPVCAVSYWVCYGRREKV